MNRRRREARAGRPARPVEPGAPVQAADPVPRSPTADPEFLAGLRPIPAGPLTGAERRPAADLEGEDPDGDPVTLRIREQAGPVLLCFLTPRCDGCREFWLGLGDPPGEGWPDRLSVVALTRGPATVDRAEVAALAAGATRAGRVPVVMGDRAWTDYQVTGYPFFVLVDPVAGTVVGETVGFGWADVRAMVGAAVAVGSAEKPVAEGPPGARAD